MFNKTKDFMNRAGRVTAVLAASAAVGLGVNSAPNLSADNHEPAQSPQAQAAHAMETDQVNRLNDTERAILPDLSH